MRSASWFIATLLVLAGCWSSKDSALFANDGSPRDAGGGGMGGSSGASAGTASAATGGVDTGGTAAASGKGGDVPSASAGTGANGGSGGSGGQPVQIPVITDCTMVEGASVSEINGHCYRVAFENYTFAQARDACHAAGGHLATISSKEENDFLRDLHDGEHWIGATDGRDDNTPGAGTYRWVTDEPWTFSEWEEGQPNAYETDCPNEDDEADCFEHCAFQSDEGDWNDRSCWHTVVSICEWDIETEVDPGAGGAGGGGGVGGAAGAPAE